MKFKNLLWEIYYSCYDVLLALKPYQKMQDDIIRWIKNNDSTFVNFGIGTANFECEKMREYSRKTIVGYDFSEKMISRSRSKLNKNKINNVNLVQKDLDEVIPTNEINSFDEILMQNSLYTLKEPQSFIKNVVATTLKIGGIFIVVNPKNKQNFFKIFQEHLQSGGKLTISMAFRLIGVMLINLFIVGKASKQSYHFFEGKELEEILKENGFSIMYSSYTYANQCTLIISIKE